MLRIPHCLDSRLTDGSKVVSPTHPPHFTPQNHHYFYVSGTHFCITAFFSRALVDIFCVNMIVLIQLVSCKSFQFISRVIGGGGRY
jgi:hypothetical protein